MYCFKNNSFQVLDEEGVQMATEKGRGVREDLKIGICGEYGGGFLVLSLVKGRACLCLLFSLSHSQWHDWQLSGQKKKRKFNMVS